MYLEWAPSNVLSQSLTSESNEKSGAIGENEVKRMKLEQHLKGLSDGDIDQDRVEVCHITLLLPVISVPVLFTINALL